MISDKIQLEENEYVLTQTRRHWFSIAAKIALACIIALLPGITLLGMHTIFAEMLPDASLANYAAYITYGYSAWLLLVWFGIFTAWTNYYLDVFTLTDRRIILTNQKGFFWRNVASFRLERLQDMHYEINGLLATMLDYGTIHAETAGHSDDEFRATELPHPRELKAHIMTASDKRYDRPNAAAAGSVGKRAGDPE